MCEPENAHRANLKKSVFLLQSAKSLQKFAALEASSAGKSTLLHIIDTLISNIMWLFA